MFGGAHFFSGHTVHMFSISTTSSQSTCHSAPVSKILSKSDHPRQKKMTSCRFSRWRISTIMDFRDPIMGSLKSLITITQSTCSWGTSLVVYYRCCRLSTRSRRCHCRSAYHHLRQIRPTLQSLSRDAAKTLVQAFISSRLDYCNSVLHGVTDNLLQRLQSVQNAASARLIMRTGRGEHISPVLQELHWLPVRRVDFKLATLMFKSLHGCVPSYLSDACKSAPEASCRLRSSVAITCVIPWSRTRLGDRSFDVAGPRLWNKLPALLRSADNLCQFRRQLKTFFFVKD